MGRKILKWWRRGSLIGVRGLEFSDRQRVVVINQFVILALMITLSYQITYLLTDFERMRPLMVVHSVTMLVLLMALWANYQRSHITAALLALGAPTLIQIPIVTYLISADSGLHIFLLSGGVLTFLVFSDRLRWLRYGLLLVSTVLFMVLDQYCKAEIAPVQLSSEQLVVMRVLNIAGFVLMLYILSYLFHGQLIQQRRRIQRQARALALLANTDDLTQLPNRRRIISEAQPNGLFKGVVAIADIDHFKGVNDRHGHAVGDAILKGVAEIMEASIRDIDTVGRWGGEEFIFLLSHSSPEEARLVLERVREQIEAYELNFQSRDYRVTISIGMAVMNQHRSFDEALRIADAALYRGKRLGRNCVVDEAVAY
ncbi:GGDEF domain-containing protein [Aestuariirhabdus sp. Z084]|uniref:GGDEF domain-containing protein n=1 Tax=Aestuariirhabdus haliotis TaxID=2918751 RepID=UPI00201B3D06|nr:GGDEF domain-containing protein [Aestuariirhabdus haliotis]MCL6415284.1 GGDEF domain-containing protein [Aestuariirhabdus haliotis]MCL6419544.1 GGDEF domain-containing protein [Aestuariirhabdus haliotis]